MTIAISVIFSAFNALSLSPALSALLLRPRKEAPGPLGWFFRGFNRIFSHVTNGYVSWSRQAIRKSVISLALLALFFVASGASSASALLLAIVLLTLVGAVVTAHAVGRALVGDARGTATAFLAGWGIATVIGVIPYVSGRGVRDLGHLRNGCDGRRGLAGPWSAPRREVRREAPRGAVRRSHRVRPTQVAEPGDPGAAYRPRPNVPLSVKRTTVWRSPFA